MKRLVTVIPFICLCLVFSVNAMSVEGLVTDSLDNHPIADAVLIAYTFTEDGDSVIFETWSDSSGLFSFGDLPDGTYDLKCIHPLYFSQFRRFIQISAADMALFFHFKMKRRDLIYDNSISGHVYSTPPMLPVFIPLENATVRLYSNSISYTARTNREGEFAFRNVDPDVYSVSAYAPGHIPKLDYMTIDVRKQTQIDTLDISLIPYDHQLVSLTGYVYDQNSGEPVYPAKINLYGIHSGIADSLHFETINNPDGSYTFKEIPPGVYRAECRARDYHIFVEPALELFDNSVIYDFHLRAKDPVIKNIIAGIVINQHTSLPVYNASVDLVSIVPDWSLMPSIVYSTRTDDQGQFKFESVQPWEYEIRAWAPGFEPSEPETLVIENNSQILDLKLDIVPINLNEPVSLSGFVFDASVDGDFANTPVYPAEVVLVRTTSSGESVVYSTVTNPDGSYHIENIKPSVYTVWCHADGYQQEVIHHVNLYTDTKLNFYLETEFPPGHGYISGRVVFDDSNLPVAGAILTFFSKNSYSGINHYAVTDSSGFYRSPLAPGKYYVSCSYFGSSNYYFYQEFYDDAQTISDATPVEIRSNEVTMGIDFGIPEFPLNITVRFSGIVTDDQNNPLAQARVNVWLTHPPMITDAACCSYSTLTQDDGTYDITITLPSWQVCYGFIVSAHKEKYRTEFFEEKPLPYLADVLWAWQDTSFTDINFTLEPVANQHSISGQISESNGDVIAGAYILGFRPSTGEVVFTTSDSNGFYKLAPLHRDIYFVLFIANGYVAEFFDDALRWEDATPIYVSGNIGGIDAHLQPVPSVSANAIIAGYIHDTANEPLPGVLLTAENDNGQLVGSALSDADGYYQLPFTKDGLHVLHATKVNYKSASTSLRIESDSAPLTSMDMNLEQSVLTLPKNPEEVPEKMTLFQNYPNPFNPSTTIRFEIPSVQHVRLIVYNIIGQQIQKIIDRSLQPGAHVVSWDGTDESGYRVSSGIYFLSLETASQRHVKKMILSK